MKRFSIWLVATLMAFILGSVLWMFIALEWHVPLASWPSRAWLIFCGLGIAYEMGKDRKTSLPSGFKWN